MRRTLTALFDHYDDAAATVRRLEDAGISFRDISLVTKAEGKRHIVPEGTTEDGSSGAAGGAVAGGAIGTGIGLAAGLGLITVPGLGPVVAAGWLVAALTGLAAGAASGGLVGILVKAGLGDEDAKVHAEGLSGGGTLVVVHADVAGYEKARAVLAESPAQDLAARTRARNAADFATAGAAPAQMPEGAGATSPNAMIRGDRVKGTTVYDANGTPIGKVERLMLDKPSGQVAYVAMAAGGMFGTGDTAQAIPWGALTYDPHLQGYRTSLTEDRLRAAPAFAREADLSDRERERALHDHYGARYYWEA